jgi:hypothetical protein
MRGFPTVLAFPRSGGQPFVYGSEVRPGSRKQTRVTLGTNARSWVCIPEERPLYQAYGVDNSTRITHTNPYAASGLTTCLGWCVGTGPEYGEHAQVREHGVQERSGGRAAVA